MGGEVREEERSIRERGGEGRGEEESGMPGLVGE